MVTLKATGKPLYIERQMYLSKAWQELVKRTRHGTTALLIFHHKKRVDPKKGRSGRSTQYEIKNQGEITFSYGEATKYLNVSKTTFSRILDALIELGFIDLAHTGGQGKQDHSLYGISQRWKTYGTNEFISKSRPKSIHAKNASGFPCVIKAREK
jgi:hypothetical protein